jgi:hypothetical protein
MGPARSELAQQPMQPAHRLRAQRAQLVAAIAQQPQADQRVITAHHRNARAAQRSWRLRPGLRDCERLSILLHHGWMREPKHHRTDQTDGATVPRSRSGAGKRRWLDPSGAHISDLDRGPWISCAIGTWPNHLRSNAPAMPDTSYKCTQRFRGRLSAARTRRRDLRNRQVTYWVEAPMRSSARPPGQRHRKTFCVSMQDEGTSP